MTEPGNTTPQMLQRAAEIGAAAGLRYVYAGNLPGKVGDLEDTHCPHCREVLDRTLWVPDSRIQSDSGGRLPFLRHAIPGRWSDGFTEQRTAFPIPLRLRAGPEPMMRDLLGRPLKNLRLSVTDRCNLRCSYCMPEAEYVWLPRQDILQFEEMSTLVDVFARAGVDRVRLTGGEPLLRRDLPELDSHDRAQAGDPRSRAHHQRRDARRARACAASTPGCIA